MNDLIERLRKMYELLQRCENEMRYAGWEKREADNFVGLTFMKR
jgi:hypothetical protein